MPHYVCNPPEVVAEYAAGAWKISNAPEVQTTNSASGVSTYQIDPQSEPAL